MIGLFPTKVCETAGRRLHLPEPVSPTVNERSQNFRHSDCAIFFSPTYTCIL